MRWLKRKKNKTKPDKAARKRPAPAWVRTAQRVGIWSGVAIVAIGAPWWAIQSGAASHATAAVWRPVTLAAAGAGFTVRQVLAEGRIETTQADILKALGIRGGEPILAVDPVEARKRVEALPWVRSAAVERRLPDTIRVRIVERQAMAWWQKDGRLVLIDRTGETIAVPSSGRYSSLIVLVGEDAPAQAAQLLDMLAREPDLATRVRAAVRIGQRRWNLKIDDAIDVRLPEDGADVAWSKLGELERKSRILSRDIESIDLRLPDRLIVQTKSGKPTPTGAGGRDT